MVAAALILSLFGAGVEFGWQPMPDPSSRYEYVVQLEPEMLRTLATGRSIPIVCEVPKEVQAIGRIRIVAGRGDVPREELVTRMKPAAAPHPGGGDGITLTQYTESGPSRYSTPAAGFDPYIQVPPAAAAATGSAAGSGWNGGAAAEVADASASMGPLDRLGAGIQQVTDPIRDGVGRLDNQLRTAADNFGDRTQNLLDRHLPNRPALVIPRGDEAPSAAASTASAPAAGWNGGEAESEAPGWNGGESVENADSGAPAVPPVGDEPRASWNNEVAAEDDLAPGADAFAAPSSTTPPRQFPAAPPLITGSSAAVRSENSDPWANAADERLRSGAVGGPSPSSPAAAPPTAAAVDPAASPSGPTVPAFGTSEDSPAITSGMLNLPPWRDLDGVEPSTRVASNPATGGGSLLSQAVGGGDGPAATPNPAETSAAADANVPVTPAAPSSDARSKAAVILAWVLLTGSAAGNIYLFWSYLDVRTKYRALVRKTARAVGSRFSAA